MNKIFLPRMLSALLIFILFFSCQKEKIIINDNTDVFSRFKVDKNIHLKPVYELRTKQVDEILCGDSSVFLICNIRDTSEHLIYKYNEKYNMLENGIIRGGRKEKQVLGVIKSGINNDKLWVYDITLKKMITIPLNKGVLSRDLLSLEEFHLKDVFYMVCYKNLSTLIGIGDFDSTEKISEIEKESGKTQIKYGDYAVIPKNYDNSLLKTAYKSLIYKQPSGNKIVLPYRFIDIIEIFDTKSKQSKAVFGPEHIDHKYDIGMAEVGEIMIRTKDTKSAFIQGSVTKKYIYLLYSGKNSNDPNVYVSNKVFVYDWEGNPVKKLTLDQEVYAMAVSPDDGRLFAVNPKTNQLLKADLK